MKNRAFTFIEILVVTAIISLLTGSSTVVYTGFSKQSRDARRKADLNQIRSVLEMYRTNNNSYPAALSFSQYLCDPEGCNEQGGTTYIQKLPQDPVPNKSYSYINGDDNFLLSATLENGSKYCLNRYGEDDACSTLLAAIPTSTPIPQQPTATPLPAQPTNTPIPQQPIATPTPTLQTVTFNCTGTSQSYNVPQGATWIEIQAKGAQGGAPTGGSGGYGGLSQGTVQVTPGEILSVYAGCTGSVSSGGFNGGGNGGSGGNFGNDTGGGGGGASDVRRGSTKLIVAGGGGGGASFYNNTQANGGNGGGWDGDETRIYWGFNAYCSARGGPGTQTAGGYGGPGGFCAFGSGGSAGSAGQGGNGASGFVTNLLHPAGGGGGGGYFGGGGGANAFGGGGGSGYVSGINTIRQNGSNAGNGKVTITPLSSQPAILPLQPTPTPIDYCQRDGVCDTGGNDF